MDLGALNEAHNKFVDEHGREPSEGELADYTGLSKKRIAHIRKYDKSQTFETRLQGSDSQENVSMPTVVDEADMWEDYVYQSLSGRDQLIYDLRTGKQGSQRPLGVSEIAKKLKMSPSAVSQRLSKISEEIQRGPEE
jgi:DNA-directed RNA polymerase specialized sigma subunit